MSQVPHLRGILFEIAEVAGENAALAIAGIKGGAPAYFPFDPPDDHWLVAAVGREKATLIGRKLATGKGGIELEVPLGPLMSRNQVWREIRRRLRAGETKPKIARALGIHYKTVQAHKNRHRKLADISVLQLDLFDD